MVILTRSGDLIEAPGGSVCSSRMLVKGLDVGFLVGGRIASRINIIRRTKNRNRRIKNPNLLQYSFLPHLVNVEIFFQVI